MMATAKQTAMEKGFSKDLNEKFVIDTRIELSELWLSLRTRSGKEHGAPDEIILFRRRRLFGVLRLQLAEYEGVVSARE